MTSELRVNLQESGPERAFACYRLITTVTRGAPYRRQFPLKSCRLASQRCEPDAFQSSVRWKSAASSHHAPPRKTRDCRPRHDLPWRIFEGVETSHPSLWPTVHDKTWLPPAFQKKTDRDH